MRGKGVRLCAAWPRLLYFFVRNIAPALLILLVFAVALNISMGALVREKAIAEKRRQCAEMTEIVRSEIRFRVEGSSGGEAQERLIDDFWKRLEHVRFGKGDTGYFWIIDSWGRVRNHPLLPSLQGKRPEEVGEKYSRVLAEVLRSAARVTREKRDSVIDYSWYRPDTGRYGTKLGYLAYIPEWNMVLGTGLYYDDIISDAKRYTDNIVLAALGLFFAYAFVLILLQMRKSWGADDRLRQGDSRVKEREARFQLVLERSPFGAILQDEDGAKIIRANSEFTRMVGMERESLIGHAASELGIWSPKDEDRLRHQATMATADSGGPPARLEISLKTAEGREREAMASFISLEFEGRQCRMGMLVDVTEERELQQQLEQMQKLDSLGQLAGGIAHDFNNMLAGIIGSADVMGLLMEGSQERLRPYTETILESARRASELTGKLLAFARRGRMAMAPLSMHEVIASTVSLLERSIDKGIKIQLRLEADPCVVIGDPTLIQNAILNVCLNARDAMPNGGGIDISTSVITADPEFRAENPGIRSDGACLELDIGDNGSGMPKEVLSRIFDPFFTTKHMSQGAGLGLSAVYGAMQQHGGAIRVYSEPGLGTIVKLFFPLSFDDVGEGETNPGEVLIFGHGKILVAEDEPAIRNSLSTLLKTLGYEVSLAENGAKALEIYSRERPGFDLVIMDLIMPVMNGREAIRAILGLDPGARILITSGFNPESVAGDLAEIGAHGFLQKPFRASTLSQAIFKALGRG